MKCFYVDKNGKVYRNKEPAKDLTVINKKEKKVVKKIKPVYKQAKYTKTAVCLYKKYQNKKLTIDEIIAEEEKRRPAIKIDFKAYELLNEALDQVDIKNETEYANKFN